MKEVRISTQYLEEILKKGNIINHEVVEGLEHQDRIVAVSFDDAKRELILWCDTDKIIQTEVIFKKYDAENKSAEQTSLNPDIMRNQR